MATIAKVTTGASASSALNYALGQDKAMHNDTERWLEEHQLERPDDLKNCRAVAVGGTNGIDPMIAKEQFKAVQQAFNQTQRQNQVRRITQSFADNELSALNPSDWQKTCWKNKRYRYTAGLLARLFMNLKGRKPHPR
ncbi:relaxase/mobilization nuclease domain-containing protein [Levilactobacillus brevis]